jgi:hypothetical protein
MRHTAYRRFAALENLDAVNALPRDYVAVKFYFRPSFPDTPENRQFAKNVVRALSREMPVVLLNTGLILDDHLDLDIPGGKGVHRVDHLMTPQRNLDIQTQIYGGLTYLAPFYGVRSIGFYSTDAELVPSHLDVGWRLGRLLGTPATAIDTRAADLLELVFHTPRAEGREVAMAAGSTTGMLGFK